MVILQIRWVLTNRYIDSPVLSSENFFLRIQSLSKRLLILKHCNNSRIYFNNRRKFHEKI